MTQTRKPPCVWTVLWLSVLFVYGGLCYAASPSYLSPGSVVGDTRLGRLYIAATTAAQILVWDTSSCRVIQRIPVAPQPQGLALSGDGRELYVTSAVSAGEVLIVDTHRARVRQRVSVGHTPSALALSPDGRMLYVCNQFDNTVSVIDLAQGRCIQTIAVLREPVGLAMTPAGDAVFVVNRLPVGAADGVYLAAAVSVIDTQDTRVVQSIELPDGATNVLGIAIAPDGHYAYVTHVMARYQFPVTFLEKSWVNTNALSVLNVPQRRFVNTVLLDDSQRGAADPHAVVCTADGTRLLVSHAGSHELSVIDRKALHRLLPVSESARNFVSCAASKGDAFLTKQLAPADRIPNKLDYLQGIRRRVPLTGKGPRGMALLGAQVYVTEYFSDSLSRVAWSRSRTRPESHALGSQLPLTPQRRGELFFHDASDSYQTWHSCATCHGAGARANALNWDLLNDGIANPKNTKSLLLSYATPPAMATGVRAHMESAIRSGIYYIQFMIPRGDRVQAISAYLKNLEPVPSPALAEGGLSPAARRGEKLFSQAGCVGCHTPPTYTNQQKVDVGTGSEEDDSPCYDVPTLVEVWRTAPYLHDGRAAQIIDVLTTCNTAGRHGQVSDLSKGDVNDLVAYVLTR